MTKETELSCENCPEKVRCDEQKQKKYDSLKYYISLLETEENKTIIKDLWQHIPTLTRCDVVLEKALKRLSARLAGKEQELRKLKENSKNKCAFRCLGNEFYPDTQREIDRLKIEVEQLQAGKSFYKTWYRAKHSDVENELGRLKAENEKLKEVINKIEKFCHSTVQSGAVVVILGFIKQAKGEE